jgi:hypothetical protein
MRPIPTHLAAVTTMLASGKDRAARAPPARLRLGHGAATSLFAFGVPIVLYKAYLPESVQRDAETGVGVMIVLLALVLLNRWRAALPRRRPRATATATRTVPARRFRRDGIGVVHGVGGTAGVGVAPARVDSGPLAIVCLVYLRSSRPCRCRCFRAPSGSRSRPRVRRSFARLAPALGVISLAFGVWYALGAQSLVPYVF